MSAGAPLPSWYALRVRSRADFAVRDLLRAAGIEEYLPTYDETVKWTDRERVTTRALFPGYIFARFLPSDSPALLQTRGVVQILGTGNGEYSAIPDVVIADLRRIVGARVPVAGCPYVAGAAVRVAKGPFAGVTGVITRVKNATTLSVPVEILGRSVAVSIDAADVEAAPA